MAVLKKGKKEADPMGGRGAQRRSMAESADHWGFLEEMEAPMWLDLTLEAQYIKEDIDDAWFHTTHIIHQLSSRHLKSSFPYHNHEKPDSLEILCRSPKLPDSVSGSRGNCYNKKKWVNGKLVIESGEQHPIRTLNEKGSRVASGLNRVVSGRKLPISESKSTVTTISSPAKPSSGSVSHLTGKRSINSKLRKYASLNSETCIISTSNSNSELATSNWSNVASKQSNTVLGSHTRLSVGLNSVSRVLPEEEMNQKLNLTHRKSSSSKSSIGSSTSIISKLEKLNPYATVKQEKPMKSRVDKNCTDALKRPKSRFPSVTSGSHKVSFNNSGRVSCKEHNSKALPSTAPKKALGLLNAAEPVTFKVITRSEQNPRNGKVTNNKDTSSRCTIQNLQHLKGCREFKRGNGLSNVKGKPNVVKLAAKPTKLISITHFR